MPAGKPVQHGFTQRGLHQAPLTTAERKTSSMQAVSQLTLMVQAEQQHIQFGVGIEHDVASQHKFSEFRHPDRSREQGRLPAA